MGCAVCRVVSPDLRACKSREEACLCSGSWHRCCHGRVRQLIDCCGYIGRRINGDGALTGYCYRGRKVFCVMYYDTKTAC